MPDDRLRDDEPMLTAEEQSIKNDPKMRELAERVGWLYNKIGGPQAINVVPHPTAHVADRVLVEWLFAEGGPFHGKRYEFELEVLQRFVEGLEQMVAEYERQAATNRLFVPPGGLKGHPRQNGAPGGLGGA